MRRLRGERVRDRGWGSLPAPLYTLGQLGVPQLRGSAVYQGERVPDEVSTSLCELCGFEKIPSPLWPLSLHCKRIIVLCLPLRAVLIVIKNNECREDSEKMVE